LRTPIALASLLVLAACGGGGGGSTSVPAGSVPSAVPTSVPTGLVQPTFHLTIPVSGSASKRRSPKFISSSMQSISILLKDVNGSPVGALANNPATTPENSTTCGSGCTVLGPPSPPGSDTFAITTYDGGSNALDTATGTYTLTVGITNSESIVLEGIPASFSIGNVPAPSAGGILSSTIGGPANAGIEVSVFDADGNTIVGAGSPTFSVAAVVGSGFTVSPPTTTAPNTFALTPPGTNGQGATFTVTAAYSDATCSTAGAVCSATFTVKNDVQTLFIADSNGNVEMYAAPFTGTPTAITNGINGPNSLAMDAAGHLFVGNINSDVVTEYAAPYTGAPIASTTSGDIGEEQQIALDASGNLFVADAENNAVEIFAPPYSGTPIVITNGINLPFTIAVDGADFFVGNLEGSANVKQFTPPFSSSSTPAATITTGEAPEFAFDRTANLFILSLGGDNVEVFSPPYTAGGTTITTGMNNPDGIALDGTGNLFVANTAGPSSNVEIYGAPYTGTPQTVHGLYDPEVVAVDGSDTLYVADSGGATPGLYVFAPPYTGAATVNTNGSWTAPAAILFSP